MTTIRLTAATTKKPEWAMTHPVDFALETGEHIAIVGRNAAGKSMLVDMITGRHPVFPDMAEYHFEASPYGGDKRGAIQLSATLLPLSPSPPQSSLSVG
jgi:molybdate transport system ATP-binding protein